MTNAQVSSIAFLALLLCRCASASQAGTSTSVTESPVTKASEMGEVRTIREYKYSDDLFITRKNMVLPFHPCDYSRCAANEACVVMPGFKRPHGQQVSCKPRCVPLIYAVRKTDWTSRECYYRPHDGVANVEVLHCNCRLTCPEEVRPRPVCGSDGKTYRSYCWMQRANCLQRTAVIPESIGPCRPALAEREACTPEVFATQVTTAFRYVRLMCSIQHCTDKSLRPVWYKEDVMQNGKLGQKMPLQPNKPRTFHFRVQGMALFAILGSRVSDTGMYTCEVATPHGTLRHSQFVIVQMPTSQEEYLQRKMAFMRMSREST